MKHSLEHPSLPSRAFQKQPDGRVHLHGGGGKGGQPDYIGQAYQQGLANQTAAISTAALNNPNRVTPYGSTTWQYTPSGAGGNYAAYAPYTNGSGVTAGNAPSGGTPMSAGSGAMNGGGGGNLNQNMFGGKPPPFTNDFTDPLGLMHGKGTASSPIRQLPGINPGDYTQVTNLSPDQQALFNAQQGGNQQLASMLPSAIQNAGGVLTHGINTSGLPDVFQGAEANQHAAQDATYNSYKQYLDPQFAQSDEALTSQLANQGINLGSAAYDTAMANAGRTKQQAYSNAANQSVLSGLTAAQQAFNQNLGARQQGIGEQQQNAQQIMQNLAQLYGYTAPQIPNQQATNGSAVQAPNYAQAGAQQAQYQMQQQQSNTQGLASLAALAAMFI